MSITARARRILFSLIIVVLTASGLPHPARALTVAPNAAFIPDLRTFTESVVNGNRDTLRGVYVDGVLALPVLQQVYSAQVWEKPDSLTQFALPWKYGVTGLLAHNWLSGVQFFKLRRGQEVKLVYGDGRYKSYYVTQILRFKATLPESVYSQFIDLENGKGTDAEGMFYKVYTGGDHVTFQTCIEKDGDLSWGRLFVIANPTPPPMAPMAQARLLRDAAE